MLAREHDLFALSRDCERGDAMAIEMFLKLAGIDGESTDAKHKGEIDVLAWSWGLSQEASGGPPGGGGGGGGAGRAKIENISIQKLVDLASPLLLSFSAQGKHIKDGILTTRKPGKKGTEFLHFKMTNVLVTSVQVAASNGDNVPAESVTLSFGKVEFNYRATNPDGSLGAEKSFKWDVAAAKPF
jgi:type VI secretion system secreted protein Hcp